MTVLKKSLDFFGVKITTELSPPVRWEGWGAVDNDCVQEVTHLQI